MKDKYPEIVWEEAEILVDEFGWWEQMYWYGRWIQTPVGCLNKNQYIYGLWTALYYELEECSPDECTLTPEQIPAARIFLQRAQACERREVQL